jgi:protoheme IX farnesyltransferase
MLIAKRREGPSSLLGTIRDYALLTKPTIVMLMLVTGLPALFMADGAGDPAAGAIALLGTWLAASSASAINHYLDRQIDAVMERTRHRPIPGAKVAPERALAFGIALGVLAMLILGLLANWVAAGVALASILFYTLVYTAWLKPRTPQNIVIGGAAGATAPLIVWAALSGHLGLGAWLMFAIIFVWTPPHFWALALFRQEDYAKARIPMLPVVAGEETTRRQMLAYTLALVPVTLSLYALGLSGGFYLAVALVLNALFVRQAWRLLRARSVLEARRMFVLSNVYLMLLFVALFLDAAWRYAVAPLIR